VKKLLQVLQGIDTNYIILSNLYIFFDRPNHDDMEEINKHRIGWLYNCK